MVMAEDEIGAAGLVEAMAAEATEAEEVDMGVVEGLEEDSEGGEAEADGELLSLLEHSPVLENVAILARCLAFISYEDEGSRTRDLVPQLGLARNEHSDTHVQ